MLKNTLSTAAATIAIVASASLPAAASGLAGIVDQANEPNARVPEPSTILGTLAVGGIGLLTAKKKGAESNEEQK